MPRQLSWGWLCTRVSIFLGWDSPCMFGNKNCKCFCSVLKADLCLWTIKTCVSYHACVWCKARVWTLSWHCWLVFCPFFWQKGVHVTEPGYRQLRSRRDGIFPQSKLVGRSTLGAISAFICEVLQESWMFIYLRTRTSLFQVFCKDSFFF